MEHQNIILFFYNSTILNNATIWLGAGPKELKLRLKWPARFKICLGIARGLAFLNEESKLKIVHRDIKPINVLPDKDLNAKISDLIWTG